MSGVAPVSFQPPLTGNETIRGYSKSPNGQPCGEDFVMTTAQIAALAGGGGVNQYIPVNSGTTVSGVLGAYYGFNSSATSQKNINAPAATGSLKAISAGDLAGTAFNYPINFVTAGGDVVLGNQTQIYTNGGSASWIDLAPGLWAMQ